MYQHYCSFRVFPFIYGDIIYSRSGIKLPSLERLVILKSRKVFSRRTNGTISKNFFSLNVSIREMDEKSCQNRPYDTLLVGGWLISSLHCLLTQELYFLGNCSFHSRFKFVYIPLVVSQAPQLESMLDRLYGIELLQWPLNFIMYSSTARCFSGCSASWNLVLRVLTKGRTLCNLSLVLGSCLE